MKFEVLTKLPPPELEKLYCFNSQSSYDQIETILGETDVGINHQQLHAQATLQPSLSTDPPDLSRSDQNPLRIFLT